MEHNVNMLLFSYLFGEMSVILQNTDDFRHAN